MPPQENPTLDPKVLKVLRGIRTVESGGDYNAIGDNGASAGAFQWNNNQVKLQPGQMPARFLDHAKEAGVQVNDFSRASQNKVAYSIMKKWKDEGLQPEEIAAKWNGARKDPTTGRLTYVAPEYGVKFRKALGAMAVVGQVPTGQSQVPVQPEQTQQNEEGGGIAGFLKSMVSAPATILARPFQALQSGIQLAATDWKGMEAEAKKYNDEAFRLAQQLKTMPEGYQKDQLKAQIQAQLALGKQATDRLGKAATWKPSAGGVVAEAPESFADVKKDIGRGVQTAAFGLGPVSGGAAFGAGYSMEQGNDLLSTETAFNTVLGAAGGKVLDLVGRPLLDASGKVIGKITPEVLKAVAGRGANAITQFAAQHEILPGVVSRGVNKGADVLERGLNAPFNAAGNVVKAPFVQNDAKVVAARERALQDLEEKYAQLRANAARDPKGTAASRGRVAKSNVLTEDGMINEDGVVIGASRASEAYEAEAIGEGNKVVRQLLDREGVTLDLNVVQREMERVMRETFDGAELAKALKQVQREIDGLRIKRPNGRITLSELHDNKISSRPKGKDYDDPSKAKMKKAVSRTYRETIEKNSKENIREINAELQKFYDDAEYIANLQGKRIESGKLGKAVARVGGAVSGAVIGGALGGLPGVAAGSYVGGVVSSKLAGKSLQKAFGKPTKLVTPKSKVIGEAVTRANAPRNQLMLPAPSGKTPIPLQPPKSRDSVTGVKAPSYVDRDPKTGRYRKVFLSSDAPQLPSKTAEKAYQSTVANGGITISLKGDTPVAGLAYAPFKGTERVIPKKDFTPKHLDTYIDDHYDELSQPGNHLGTWEFEGNVYMDVSKVGPNTPETKELAVAANQLGVFDLESFETIELGKLQDGRYIRTYAKETNLPNLNRGENKGANKGGGDGKLPEVREGAQPVVKGGIGKVGEGKVGGGEVAKVQYKQFGKQLRKQIQRDLLGDKTKAVVVDSDTIKKAHPDYDPKRPERLHKESSNLSKELLTKAIDEDTTGLFRMTGGGAGSGKSEAVLKRIKNKPSVIFDGVLGNPASAIEKIDYALSKGKKVEIYPVYAPIELATLFNRIRSRAVPSDQLIEGHYGFRDTIPQLIEKYGNRITIKPYENSGFGVKPKKLSESKTKVKDYTNSMKMSKDEVARRNEKINKFIEKNGIDFTKLQINDMIE